VNIYMRRFVLGWKKLGLERSLGTRLVTYADDLVILCRRGNAEAALHRLREIMGKLKLTVNEDKTQICTVPEGEFDFLGFTFGRMYSRTTGQARLALRPSMKSMQPPAAGRGSSRSSNGPIPGHQSRPRQPSEQQVELDPINCRSERTE
jgi:hypothetical protein